MADSKMGYQKFKEKEDFCLGKLNRMKRFDKIARLRQEQGFEQEGKRETGPA